MTATMELAQQYTAKGYSVFPVLPHDKRPHFELLAAAGWIDKQGRGTWEPAINHRAEDSLLHLWFDQPANIAIVGGPVSDNRIFLDFDDPDSYRRWGLAHKQIVNNTPVQKTAKGYHVVVQSADVATGPLYYEQKKVGEVRGQGGYAVVPPSIHQSGNQYRWLIDPFRTQPLYIESLTELNLARTATTAATVGRNETNHYVIPKNQQKVVGEALGRLATWRREDYTAWLAVGMALVELGEVGRDLWHNWSASSQKYDAAQLDAHFDSFGRHEGRVLTLASLFYWAKQDDPLGQQRHVGKNWRSM